VYWSGYTFPGYIIEEETEFNDDEPPVIRFFKAKVTKVGFKGEVSVTFGYEIEPMVFNSSSLKVWTNPHHNLTWEFVSFDKQLLNLHLNFSNPLNVSSKDILMIEFTEQGYSMIKCIHKNTFYSRENMVISAKIPK
jgi:hypothetical protein